MRKEARVVPAAGVRDVTCQLKDFSVDFGTHGQVTVPKRHLRAVNARESYSALHAASDDTLGMCRAPKDAYVDILAKRDCLYRAVSHNSTLGAASFPYKPPPPYRSRHAKKSLLHLADIPHFFTHAMRQPQIPHRVVAIELRVLLGISC